METGFYNISKLPLRQLKNLYKEVLGLSYLVICESKYTDRNESYRGIDDKYSINDFMSKIDKKNHNVFIDRSIQHVGNKDMQKGEIGFCLSLKYDPEWYQITFNITLDNLKMLIAKYKIEKL